MGLKEALTPEQLAEYVNPPINYSFSKIGNLHGVSRQRIHQLYKEYKESYSDLFMEKMEPSQAELAELLERFTTLKEVAEHLSVTTNRLKRMLKQHGLKKTFVKEALSEEVLYKMYVDEEKSDEEIAEQYRCSPNTVMKLRYQFGIYESMRKPLSSKLTRERFLMLYEGRNVTLQQLAMLFDTHIQHVITLKREYNIPKRRASGVTQDELQGIKEQLRLSFKGADDIDR